MAKWDRRPNVRTCEHLGGDVCPCCVYQECYHPKNANEECTEEDCPLFDGKKWKK